MKKKVDRLNKVWALSSEEGRGREIGQGVNSDQGEVEIGQGVSSEEGWGREIGQGMSNDVGEVER